MSALCAKNVSASVFSSRALRSKAVCAPAVRRQTRVVVRAESSSSGGEDVQAQLQESFDKTSKFLKDTWDTTADAEKPAIVAIIIGVTIAQLSIGATLDAVERIPLMKVFLEFVGLAVSGVYGYRYFTEPAERESWKKTIDEFVSSVTGQ